MNWASHEQDLSCWEDVEDTPRKDGSDLGQGALTASTPDSGAKT